METDSQAVRVSKIGRIVLALLIVVSLAVGAGFVLWPKKIAGDTWVADIALGGQSVSQSRTLLDAWWNTSKNRPISFYCAFDNTSSMQQTPSELGIDLDVDATIAQLPLDSPIAWVKRSFNFGDHVSIEPHLVFNLTGVKRDSLVKVYEFVSPAARAATVILDGDGNLAHRYEVASSELDIENTLVSLALSVENGIACQMIGIADAKRVEDTEIDKIVDVVSEFSTKFSVWDKPRSQNLKIAAGKIDGYVILPGEKFSFNTVVGERSEANGFNLAGVYRRGRHEIDFGGGVCQVITTLFNAAMLANLTKNYRVNHSFAVPYVPVGRDAAVAYGEQDMAFTNTSSGPIAISAEWKPGLLTFRILGKKDATERIEITQEITSSWMHPVKYIDDKSLPPGKEKVLEKGGKGFKAITHRKVFRDDVLVSEVVLFKSHYKGAPKIVARGPTVVDPITGG